MPRICGSDNSPHDYCNDCLPSATEDAHKNDGDGPDGRGDCYEHNADHPPYEDTDYTCEECGNALQEHDN